MILQILEILLNRLKFGFDARLDQKNRCYLEMIVGQILKKIAPNLINPT